MPAAPTAEDADLRARVLAVEKRALREAMRRRLAGLDAAARRASGDVLIARLTQLPAWRAARRVLLFAPEATEPDLDRLWDGGALAGKEVHYPIVAGTELRVCRVTGLEELRPVSPWNLREPALDPARLIPPGELDLLLAPGLAFDGAGGRLGRGGGYYDRLLATCAPGRPWVLGVGFECQRVSPLPLAPHDARLDALVLC